MIEIVPAKLTHLRAVIADLREEERFECEHLGLKPRHILHQLWLKTDEPRAAVSNGHVLAVGGAASAPLISEAHVWLFTTRFVEAIPLSFVKAIRGEIERLMADRVALVSSAHETCRRPLRLFKMLGFEISASPHVREGFLELRLER